MSILTDPEIQVMMDWTMQFLTMLGTWLAGVGTLVAAGVALWLARRAEKVKLEVHVGVRALVFGGGRPIEECLAIHVTNLGERPVTIVSVGWCVGKGRNKRFAMDPSASNECPKKLEYGETKIFTMSFAESPSWIREFSTGFVQIPTRKHIKTLRAQIHTSVSYTENVIPEENFLKKIEEAGQVKGL